MKNFYIIFLTFIFFTSNVFGYSCYFGPYSGDIRVADINDRQIYTLFTSHVTTEFEEFENILNLDAHMTIKLFLWQELLRKHADRINSEKSDFRQISFLLTSQEIDWIGVEQPIANYIQEVERLVQVYRNDKEKFARFSLHWPDIWSEEKTNDLFYLVYPVGIKLRAEYPNKTSEVNFIPLEDEDLYLRASYRNSSQALEEIINIFNNTENTTIEKVRAFRIFITDHPSFLNSSILIDPSEVEEFFTSSGIESPELIRRINAYVNARNEESIVDRERDKFVVDSILAQEGNGLVLRGSAHQEYIENALTQACLESRGF